MNATTKPDSFNGEPRTTARPARIEPYAPMWNDIPASDRTLWFGVAVEGMEAPWMSGLGACLVKIWDIRRRADGVVEYGIGNETKPPPDKIGWITGDKFYGEWPD